MIAYGESLAPRIVRNIAIASLIGTLATAGIVYFAVQIWRSDVNLVVVAPAIVILYLVGYSMLKSSIDHHLNQVEGMVQSGQAAADPDKMLLYAGSLYWIFKKMPWFIRRYNFEVGLVNLVLNPILRVFFGSSRLKSEDDLDHLDHLAAKMLIAFEVGCKIRDLRQRRGDETAILNAKNDFDKLMHLAQTRMPDFKAACTRVQNFLVNGPLVFGAAIGGWFCLVQFMNS